MCNSVDCSKDGVVNLQSTAGRVDNPAFKSVMGSITVGKYDHSKVPAVNIFGKGGCSGASRRLYASASDHDDARTVEYG